MTRFPRGIVTFLGATISPSYPGQQAELIRTAMKTHGGVLFHDDGATIYAVFSAAVAALEAALQAQWDILLADQGSKLAAGSAMAIHTGRTNERNGIYFGPTLNRVMSILDATHPGQVVISATTHSAFYEGLPANIQFQLLGEYRLNDLFRTAELYQVLVPNLPSQFPPLITLDGRPHNLPIQDSPLIGREQEVAACCELIRTPELRLLTLLGSSGMGKTRLALQLAVEVINDFSDGVWFVALASVSDPDLLVSMIAQTLGVKEQPDQPLLATLTTFLQEKRLLLVLDNFEQLWSAAPTITELLESTRHTKVLVTSQKVLEIENEEVFAVPPLAMPSTSEHLSVDELSHIPAVALFIERARDVQPSFTFTAAMAPAVIELCMRLEGLPLAIELVAAQSKRYFPADILMLLQNRLLVARTIRQGNTREDTLRPVLDWICEVLGASMAGLFARLGVFVGGCTAESAREICNPTNDLALEVDAALNVLLENHLLLREELKEGHTRYTMLDAIHDYARQRLAKRREQQRLQQAHASYYTSLAETAEELLKGSTQELWLAYLEDEHHNLRAALSRSSEEHPEQTLQLSAALVRFWEIRGYYTEGHHWLQTALEHAPMAPAALRAKGLFSLGFLAHDQGNLDQAQEHYIAALAIQRELGDSTRITMLINNLGIIAMARGNHTQAASLYEEGLALCRELNYTRGIAHYLSSLGTLMRYQGNLDRSSAYFEESLALYDQLEDSWDRSSALMDLGWVMLFQGAYARAEAYFGQALALAQDLDDTAAQAQIFEGQGRIHLAQGDLAAARTLLVASTRIRHQQGAMFELVRGLEAFAALRLAEGQPADMARLLGAASALRQTIGAPISPVIQQQIDAIKAQALTQISQEDYATAWQSGHTTQLDGVIDELLTSAAAQK